MNDNVKLVTYKEKILITYIFIILMRFVLNEFFFISLNKKTLFKFVIKTKSRLLNITIITTNIYTVL